MFRPRDVFTALKADNLSLIDAQKTWSQTNPKRIPKTDPDRKAAKANQNKQFDACNMSPGQGNSVSNNRGQGGQGGRGQYLRSNTDHDHAWQLAIGKYLAYSL